MRVARCRLPAGEAGARADAIGELGGSWVRFGDETLVLSANAKWRKLAARGAERGLVLEELHPDPIARGNLHLVRQKGRLFQQEHPEVPILLDKGRYLVAALAPAHAARLRRPSPLCFDIQPLRANQVVFDVAARPAAARRAPVDWVEALVDGVQAGALEAALRRLVSFPTRHSTRPEYAEAAAWARGELAAMGYTTALEPIRVGNAGSQNVVATRTGAGAGPRGLVIVVAHLDSVNLAGGRAAPAPGADDNGSGSAGLLAIARALADHRGVHDLRLVLVGGEEQGLHGSRHQVAGLSDEERSRVRAVVNMDMIGRLNTAEPTVLIEGGQVSRPVMDGLAAAAGDYTGLTVQTSLNPFASDHVPFVEAGLPAALTIEGADGANGDIHSDRDRLSTIDYDLAAEIVRMNVAFVAASLERSGDAIMTCTDSTGPLQFSGRYLHNGGAAARGGIASHHTEGEPSTLHDLQEPVFLEERAGAEAGLRFTLHIDIDGTDPLGVVSGEVAQGASEARHFIGQVTSNSAVASGGRDLVVENFSFSWPVSGEPVGRLEIRVSASGLSKPTADVSFVGATDTHGPFTVQQHSPWFREIELEVDREQDAPDAEPYDTHTHPDRPEGLPRESLTLETTFAKSGILITRSAGVNVIDTSEAGPNAKWSDRELHDAMERNWSAFANRPQWKMWIFVARLSDRQGLGGIMFDGDIDEPGGVDRQGTALFTEEPFFHAAEGGYPQANPPAAEAATRELYFNLIHETGHAFNLAHSFQKGLGTPWQAPPWMPVASDPRALSWMNYPDQASPGLSAKWFYDRFRFRFDDNENLFLRHAPARLVQMGNEDWFVNHARVAPGTLDRRLSLELRSRKKIVELGEPVTLELKLANPGGGPVMVHDNLDPSDGFVQLAVTDPRGRKRPFIPILHTRQRVEPTALAAGKALYHPVQLSIGAFGSHFKEPGAYRVEASYTNLDGSTAASVLQLYVRPPAAYDELPVVNELFNARVGRVLYMSGSRVMEDVNDKLRWVSERLGKGHPARHHLQVAQSLVWAGSYKVVDPQSKRVEVEAADPDRAEARLRPVVTDAAEAADTIGHIAYERVVDIYTRCAVKARKKAAARKAQSRMVSLFKQRQVVQHAVRRAERRLKTLS